MAGPKQPEPVQPEPAPASGSASRRKKTPSARSKARRRAVEILFEAQQRGVDAVELLQITEQRLGLRLHPYTVQVVQGVASHCPEVEAAITARSREWELDRMPAVDRAILTVGAYELLHATWPQPQTEQEGSASPVEATPAAVVISEAVDLAALLSTSASPAFINGVLDAIATPAS